MVIQRRFLGSSCRDLSAGYEHDFEDDEDSSCGECDVTHLDIDNAECIEYAEDDVPNSIKAHDCDDNDGVAITRADMTNLMAMKAIWMTYRIVAFSSTSSEIVKLIAIVIWRVPSQWVPLRIWLPSMTLDMNPAQMKTSGTTSSTQVINVRLTTVK